MKAAPFAANSRQSEVGAADDEQISRFVSEWGYGSIPNISKIELNGTSSQKEQIDPNARLTGVQSGVF